MARTWERLKQVTCNSNTTTFDSGTFTAKKYLKVVFKGIDHGTYGENLTIRFNGDTGSNYSWKYGEAGGTHASGSSTYSRVGTDSSSHDCHTIVDIWNTAAVNKLCIWRHQTVRNDSQSDGTPKRGEGIIRWSNTSAQITSVQFGFEFAENRPVKAGCMMTIWGADDQPSTTIDKSKDSITNVPVGTRYEETDTRKIFRRKGAAVSVAGLKAYFPMNEASGKLINKASDYGSTDAISNFDLTVTGGTQNTSGKIDKCVSFSGNQNAEAADSNLSDTAFLSNNSAAWSICFWSKVEGLASGGNIEGDQAWFSTSQFGSGQNGVVCRVAATVAPPNNPAYTSLILGTNGDDKVSSTSSANGLESGGAGSGTGWHFHVIQYDDSTGIARQSKDNGSWNNIFTGANLTNTTTPSHKFRLAQWADNSNNLNGDMEAFSIWNRVLTASEITTLYGNTTDVGQGLAPSWKEKGTA